MRKLLAVLIFTLSCLSLGMVVGCWKEEPLKSFEPLKPLDAIETVIHESPSIMGSKFNPQRLIRAVNILHPLGKEKALAVLRSYAEKTYLVEYKIMSVAEREELRRSVATKSAIKDFDEQRVFFILRVLFVHKDDKELKKPMPRMHIGATAFEPLENPVTWPLFPLALEHDIPFLLVDGYALGGEPESPLSHIDYCEKHCRIRDKPLQPILNPLLATDSLTKSERWTQLYNKKKYDEDDLYDDQWMIRVQALRAVKSVYLTPEEKHDKFHPRLVRTINRDKEWQRHLDTFSKLKVFWDPKTNDYSK